MGPWRALALHRCGLDFAHALHLLRREGCSQAHRQAAQGAGPAFTARSRCQSQLVIGPCSVPAVGSWTRLPLGRGLRP